MNFKGSVGLRDNHRDCVALHVHATFISHQMFFTDVNGWSENVNR